MNMASTVRISDSTKTKMKQLIQYLSFKANQTLSQKQILDILVQFGMEKKDDLLMLIEKNEVKYDWTKDPIFDEIDLEMDEDTSEKVDEIVYKDI